MNKSELTALYAQLGALVSGAKTGSEIVMLSHSITNAIEIAVADGSLDPRRYSQAGNIAKAGFALRNATKAFEALPRFALCTATEALPRLPEPNEPETRIDRVAREICECRMERKRFT